MRCCAAHVCCVRLSSVSDLDVVRADLRAEVADIRVLASMADRDAAGVRGIVRAQNALHETQVEQAQTLRGMGDALGALVAGSLRQEEIPTAHGQALASQGATLAAHGEALATHGKTLTRLVDGQEALAEKVARHDDVLAEILRRVSGDD